MISKPIEIDPSLNTYPHNYMTTTYESARRDRLADIIGDYITDENTSVETFYNDLISEINIWVEYYQKYLNKSTQIKNMLNKENVDEFKV